MDPAARISDVDPRAQAIARLLAVVDRLRAPDGCPWDRKQTIESMAPHLVEEAHEALEAVERAAELASRAGGKLESGSAGDAEIAEELGDLLMVVALICRIAQESGRFDLARSADVIAEKLVRRHPHVFGEVKAETADQVLANWEAIKKEERSASRKDDSALAGVPVALPALQRAHRLCGKAVSAGFRWSSAAGALAKIDEERGELRQALSAAGFERASLPGAATGAASASHDALASASAEQRAAVEHELGDLLLASAFFASYLKLDPEKLCRQAARRFEERFRTMEAQLGGTLEGQTLDRLLAAWQAAKLEQP